MDTGENQSSAENTVIMSTGLSWVAYIRLVLGFIILFLFVAGAYLILPDLGLVLFVLLLLFFILNILQLRSVRIYVDQQGIWCFRGIFPWSKGTHGVKWRDLDEAVFFTGFISWIAKSYRISIRHRFTKSNELSLKDVKDGNLLVQRINEIHMEIVRES